MRWGRTRPGMPRRLLLHVVIGALLVSGLLGASSCEPGMSKLNRDINRIFAITVVIVVVVVAAAVSDVDECPAADGPDFDCAVTNGADQAFEMWESGVRLGVVEAGQTCYYTLGPGGHELSWLPLEYGREFYDLHELVTVPDGRAYCRITLQPQLE